MEKEEQNVQEEMEEDEQKEDLSTMADRLRIRSGKKPSYVDFGEEEVYAEVEHAENTDNKQHQARKKKPREDLCSVCKSGEKLIPCATCPAAYHLGCIVPPLKVVPRRKWSCAQCADPLNEIDKFLDCQFRPLNTSGSKGEDDAETGSLPESQVKQYLVKWKSRSYLHPSWIPEADLETAAKANPGLKMKLNHFRKLFDSPKGWNTLEDDWIAIRPEWTTVEKVLDFRQTGALKEYLVKWKELGYEDITWEIEEDISAFQAQIDRFNARRNRRPTNTSKKRKGSTLDGRETKKKRKEFKAVEETPKFLVGGILHPYQLEGLNFLRFAWHQQKHVILADEMGLGKTIQSIAFLASLMEEGISLPHLVVAPLSTLRNWEREFATWAPHMNTVMYAGSAPARAVIRAYEFYFPKEKEPKKKRKNSKKKQASGQKLKDNKQDRIKFDVLLTSYEMINIDTAILKSLKWGCLIVDEGHRLKNKDSKLFQTMRQYSTMHRVLLTGTPLQNNLDELFMLMHFLDAGKFASLDDFQQEFKDINQEEQIARLHKMLAPHLLRRVKKDVLKDLPPKKELILRVELSPLQKDYYKAILTKNYELLSRRSGPQISLNNVVMELRKLCGHPYLLPGVEEELRRSQDLHRQLVEASGKLLLMDKMMVKLKALGHRVLIYCQFKLMLDILEDWLSVKKWGYERIDGQISGSERQIRIDRFNAPNSTRFCFLLSTRAGGLGINLASADTVIIYDSDWNPHADLQAMARAHRLGQTNKVMIYRLVTRGSIEERMMQLTKKKMVLEHLVVGRLKTKQVLNQEELDDILRYGAAELFAEEGDETKKSQQIHYDDAAIDRLLDRSQIENDDVAADVEDNDFLKAFKVANFEYIDEEATAPEKVVLDVMADRDAESSSNYWDTLLKQRFEEKKYESLTELGKGKRARKQVVHATEDDLAGMTNVTSDEEDDVPVIAETNVGVKESSDVSGKKPPVSKKKPRGPAPLMEGEGKSLSILGFSRRQRAIFVQILMRFGLGDFSWNEFIPRLKPKTADEIREYGTAFLTHIAEDITDSPTFSDGVPKEGLRIQDVLVRLAILHLIQDKVKFVTEEPTSPVFSDDVHRRLPALTNTKTWKEPHDVGLLQAILKYGYGCWQEILDDEGLDFQSVICKELQLALPVGAAQSSKEKMQMLSASSREDNSALLTEKTTAVDLSQTDEEKMLPRVIDEKLPQAQSVQMADRGLPKDNQEYQLVHKRMVEFLKKRTVLLEKALNAEYHQETAADQKGEDTYEDGNAMDMRGSESANNIETQSMQHHMQTQSQVPSQLQTQQLHSQCPNLVPLVPNEVVAHAYDNEPSRLEIGRIYNEICRLINESETDAEETYSGNKSAGVRLRKISRQIDVLCFRMRKMLVATNHYGSTPDRGIGQLSQNNDGLFTGIDVDAHSYQHEDDVEADMDSDPEMPSMPSTALENQRGQAFEQREMCSDKVSSFYLPHVDSVSNRFPSAIWKQDSGSGMYSTPQTNVSSWPSSVVIVDD